MGRHRNDTKTIIVIFSLWLLSPNVSLLVIFNEYEAFQLAESLVSGAWYIRLIVYPLLSLLGFASLLSNFGVYEIVSDWLSDYCAPDKVPEKLMRLIGIIGFIIWVTPSVIM